MDTTSDTPKSKFRVRYILLAIAAAFILLFAYMLFAAFTARPSPKTDYASHINERTIKSLNEVDGGPTRENLSNAWPDFVKLVNDFSLAQRNFEASNTPAPPNWPRETPWPEGELEVDLLSNPPEFAVAVKSTFARPDFAAVFDRTKSLPDMHAWRTLPSGQPLLFANLPELQDIRKLARACAQHMSIAHRDKDNKSLVEWYERTLALARIECSQSTLIEYLVGVAILHLANDRAQKIIATHTLDDATLRALDAALIRQLGVTPKSQLTRIPPSANWIENERAFFLDTVQWTHTDDGNGDGRLLLNQLDENVGVVPPGTTKPRIMNVAGHFVATRKQTVDLANQIFDEAVAQSKLPLYEARAKPDPYAQVQQLNARFIFAKLMLRALSNATASEAKTQLNISALRIAIAIERYRLRTGNLPDALEQLIPTELAEIPPDPFSPQGLKYKKLDMPDAQGRAYLLYTVGLDNTDNNATELEGNNRQFPITGRSEGKGYDYIIAPPAAETDEAKKR